MKIVYVPMTVYLGAQAGLGANGWWFVGLFAVTAFLIVDTIPDLLVRPYVSSGGSLSFTSLGIPKPSVSAEGGIHTGTLMFAYVLGPFLFGWYGIFLAPMVLVCVIHFARIVLPKLITGESTRPHTVDPTNLVGDEVGDPSVDAEDGPPEGRPDDPDAGYSDD
jgi:predicted PurR-regulated permease PerM